MICWIQVELSNLIKNRSTTGWENFVRWKFLRNLAKVYYYVLVQYTSTYTKKYYIAQQLNQNVRDFLKGIPIWFQLTSRWYNNVSCNYSGENKYFNDKENKKREKHSKKMICQLQFFFNIRTLKLMPSNVLNIWFERSSSSCS